ncbi:MAG TPA: VWA domain-containing protein [Acidobacteriota bacterium]|jgi:VWFA-related protein
MKPKTCIFALGLFCLLIFGGLSPTTAQNAPSQNDLLEKTIDAANIQSVEVRTDLGQIRIRGWENRSIAVRAKKLPGTELSINQLGTELQLRPTGQRQGVEYMDLYLPANLSVKVITLAADIVLQQINGPIYADTVSGKIHLFENKGKIQAVNNFGEIRILTTPDFAAQAELKSKSGDIHITLGNESARVHAVTQGAIYYNGAQRAAAGKKESVVDVGGGATASLQASSNTGKIVIQASRPAGQSTVARNNERRPAEPVADPRTQASSRPAEPYPQQAADNSGDRNYPSGSQSAEGTSGDKKNYKVLGSTVDSGYAIRTNVDYINLNVSVRDRSNRSIPMLRKEDFLVYEDGQPQQVDKLLAADVPFSLLLLMDVSGSTSGFEDLMKEAAINFLRQLKPQDEVAVATFSSDVQMLSDFSNRRYDAERAIQSIRSHGGTAFYDALDASIHDYMTHVKGRKAIVVFTDGVDNQMEGRGSGSTTTFNELIRGIQEIDTIIYPIFLDTEGNSSFSSGGGLGRVLADILSGGGTGRSVRIGGGGKREYYERAHQELAAIAEQTGGRLYAPHKPEDLNGVYRQIADDLRIQYTLSYLSSNPVKDGRWRRIQVRIQGHPEYAARTRLGYYAVDETRRRADSRGRP